MSNLYLEDIKTIDLLRILRRHVRSVGSHFLEEAIERLENEKGNPSVYNGRGDFVAGKD